MYALNVNLNIVYIALVYRVFSHFYYYHDFFYKKYNCNTTAKMLAGTNTRLFLSSCWLDCYRLNCKLFQSKGCLHIFRNVSWLYQYSHLKEKILTFKRKNFTILEKIFSEWIEVIFHIYFYLLLDAWFWREIFGNSQIDLPLYFLWIIRNRTLRFSKYGRSKDIFGEAYIIAILSTLYHIDTSLALLGIECFILSTMQLW